MKQIWKKGRGKLGVMQPLLGKWEATSDSPMGKFKCSREFSLTLGGKYIKLNAVWDFGNKQYVEHAIYGIAEDNLRFWSFTSDGKQSQGEIADGTDIHQEAISFEANMPAGLARMIYWPNSDETMNWAVESKNKKGWNRFTMHKYALI